MRRRLFPGGPGFGGAGSRVASVAVVVSAHLATLHGATLLPLEELRDAGDAPWTASLVRSGGGQTFTNLDSILPGIFQAGDTLNVSASGTFSTIDPRLLDRSGTFHALWNHQTAGSSLTFTLSRPVTIEVRTHDSFVASESVTVSAPGATWTITDNDLDVGGDGEPIPPGNVSGSGTDTLSVTGVGEVGSSSNGFAASSGGPLSSFTWTYSASPNAAQGVAFGIVPEPAATVLLSLALGALASRRRRGENCGRRNGS